MTLPLVMNGMKQLRGASSWIALLACAAVSACGSPSGVEPVLDEPQQLGGPKSGGQSGAEGSCSRVGGGGTVWPADEELPELGVTPMQVAELVAGSHPLELQWQPWWAAPSSSDRGSESLIFEVQWLGTTRVQPCITELDVSVRLHAASGPITAAVPAVLVPDRIDPASGALELELVAELEDAELADLLELPPAPAGSPGARTFEIRAAASDDEWTSVRLTEVRHEVACMLLTTAPPAQAQPCDRYAHSLPGPAHEELRTTDLVGDGFRPSDAITAFARLGALELRFADGAVTSARIELAPADFACSARYGVPSTSGDSSAAQETIGTAVLIPGRIRLRSDDGRIDASLDAQVTAFVADAGGWNGSAELYGMMTPLTFLEASGSTVDLELPAGELHIVSLWLDAPAMESARMQLEGYALDPGLPSFPDVAESSSDRVSCFGEPEPVGGVELSIQVEPR